LAFLLSLSGPKHSRLRSREHVGTEIEVQYSLMTYGIACPILSDEDSVKARMMIHTNYTQRRRAFEQQETNDMIDQMKRSGIIPYPNPNDVLVGRGKPYQKFSGNQILHELIRNEYLDAYERATERFQKTCILMTVTKVVQLRLGGRFLERTVEGWKITDDRVARRKVASAFRSSLAVCASSSAGSGGSPSKSMDTTTSRGVDNLTPVPPTTTTSHGVKNEECGGYPASSDWSDDTSTDDTTSSYYQPENTRAKRARYDRPST